MTTDRSPQGWTLDTLAAYLLDKISDVKATTRERFDLSNIAVNAALSASEKAIAAAMQAAEKAVTKAETAAEKRFDSVNEFRAAMKDQQNTFADRAQTDFRLAALEKKFENSVGVARGVSMSAAIAAGVVTALAATLASVVAIETVLRHG